MSSTLKEAYISQWKADEILQLVFAELGSVAKNRPMTYNIAQCTPHKKTCWTITLWHGIWQSHKKKECLQSCPTHKGYIGLHVSLYFFPNNLPEENFYVCQHRYSYTCWCISTLIAQIFLRRIYFDDIWTNKIKIKKNPALLVW